MAWLSLMAQLGININPYVQGLSRAKTEAKTFGTEVGSTLKNSLAGAFGVAAIAGLARKTMEFGGQITDMAARLDASTTGLQEWNYAAEQNGASAEGVATFFEKVADAQTKALSGNKQAISQFREFGISLEDLQKMRVEDISRKIAGAVEVGDVQKLSNALRNIGGESATKLVPAFKAGLDEMAAEAHALGLILDEEMIGKMDELGDRSDQLMQRFMGPIATFLGWINSAIQSIEQMFQLLGAFSTKIDWKDIVTGRAPGKFMDFLGSKEAQDIVANSERKQAAPDVGATREKQGESEEEKRVQKISELRLKLFEKAEKADFDRLSTEEKLFVLAQKRASILGAINRRGMSEEDRLRAQSDLIDVEGKLAGLRKEDKLGKLSTDSMAQIGGFVGKASGGNPGLDIARQQLQVQRDIARHTDPHTQPKVYF